MYAVWYDRQGRAAEVLQLGELPDPQPGPGEVRVQVRFSGVNPGDTKKRRGWLWIEVSRFGYAPEQAGADPDEHHYRRCQDSRLKAEPVGN